jgi:acyl-CoA hydrolase/GNAT superfamily N-acetyltransferase
MKRNGLLASPENVIDKIRPGMRIFLGTGAAEPRFFVRHLLASNSEHLQDLELIQIVSFSDALSPPDALYPKYRLKTFSPGWVAREAIIDGRVDLIPTRLARLPRYFETGRIPIDMAVLQITPPDSSGRCSLGVAADVGRAVVRQAALTVGEMNRHVPETYGDTFLHVSDFDLVMESSESALYFDPWPADDIYDRIGKNIAEVIEDRSCLAFSYGPLFDAVGRRLSGKRDLGVHSPFFTDALMHLMAEGVVTNRYKRFLRGKSLASYAIGSENLMGWLNGNARVELHGLDKVFDPLLIGENPRVVFIHPAGEVDLSGRVVLNTDRENVGIGPAEIVDFFNGAELSDNGRTVFALPSRKPTGGQNIRVSVERIPNPFCLKEYVDMVATEYGVAQLSGRSIRERAQALIEIAHPDDRPQLVTAAKRKHLLYADQIYLADSSRLYPEGLSAVHRFKDDLEVTFRPIKSSDEEGMRRLFYRFSDEAVYARFFSSIRSMPHTRMQAYVNVDWNREMSIVGLVGKAGEQRIVAEGRYILEAERPFAEVAFVVDEDYQRRGISSFLYGFLVRIGKERGVKGFTADVLFSNLGMMKVFERGGLPVHARLENGIYSVTIPFSAVSGVSSNGGGYE